MWEEDEDGRLLHLKEVHHNAMPMMMAMLSILRC
jgi:hypothetical protein